MAKVQKFSVSLMPDVYTELEKRIGKDGNRSMEINRALKHWFSMMAQAKRRIGSQLSREEKALILDATNGTMLSDDFTAANIYADVEDAISFDELDQKWGVIDAPALVDKVRNLTPPECFALAEAIQDWWAITIDDRDYNDLLKP